MMGITMLKVPQGSEADAYRSLKNMSCVKEVHHLLGEFPLFVIIQSENMARLKELIESVKERSGATDTWHVLVSNDSGQCNSGGHPRTLPKLDKRCQCDPPRAIPYGQLAERHK